MSVSLPSTTERRPVPPLGAFLEGWRRVLSAPAVLVAVTVAWWGFLQMMAGTPTLIGFSGVSAPNAWSYELYGQLQQHAFTFSPELVPFFQSWMPGIPLSPVTLAETLVWLFIMGGAIDRFARGRRVGSAAFFAACGAYFVRFLRLVPIIAVVGYLIWIAQAWWLPAHVYSRIGVLLLVNVLSVFVDFAKVRAVVEDRLSMLGALAASVRFVRRRVGRVAVLLILNALAAAVVIRFQYQLAWATPPGWLFPIVSFLWLMLGVATKLAFMASAAVFFQGELAHAGYTAAPIPVWPDSPTVEAMENLRKNVKA